VRFALTRKFKFTLNLLKRPGEERGWPGYLLGGHVRTSTVALILAFLAVWWVYDTYHPSPEGSRQVPATEVVPPGFVPDPNYTWVPRSRLQRPPSTVTVTMTPTTTTSPPPSTTSPPPFPPPIVLPPPFGPPPPAPPIVLPPPFGPPPPTTTTTAPPEPGPAPPP
jgi:hypothetical protein